MNKNIFIAMSAALMLTMSAKAEEVEVSKNIEERVTYHDDTRRVQTNDFWSNWFIGAGAGAETYFGDHDRQIFWKDRITPGASIYGGKWFTPGVGVRMAFGGWTVKGATHDYGWGYENFRPVHQTSDVRFSADEIVTNPKTGKKEALAVYPDPIGVCSMLFPQQWNYVQGRMDVMFNIQQMFSYKPDRIWSCIVYGGLSFAHTWDTGDVVAGTEDNANEIGLTGGIINSFRVAPRWAINLDITGTMFKDRFDGDYNPAVYVNRKARPEEGLLAANLGASYSFGREIMWYRAKDVTIIDNTHLNDLKKALSELDDENARLKEELANCSNVDTLVQSIGAAAPILVTFEIDKVKLRKKDRVNLGFFAEVIKASNPSIVYTITGYADEGTGTAKRNQWLSEHRAQAVYDCLVNEFGVPAERLRTDFKGGVGNMFYDEPSLSRAVITKGTLNDDEIIKRQQERK